MVESQPSKLLVAGSIPVSRSSRFDNARPRPLDAGVAQLVEHLICNQRVGGSSPSASSMFLPMSGPHRRGTN